LLSKEQTLILSARNHTLSIAFLKSFIEGAIVLSILHGMETPEIFLYGSVLFLVTTLDFL